MTSLNAEIKSVLANFQDPYLNIKWGDAELAPQISLSEKDNITIVLGYPLGTYKSIYSENLQKFLQQKLNKTFNINVTWKIVPHKVQQPNIALSPQIKNVIAIGSGKGGVGKSTTATNLAIALQKLGANVGILDADIYGPNQPQLLGVNELPDIKTNSGFKAVERFGLQSMSIGYLIDANTPMIWRGPMISQALQQLYNETLWHNLDYLILDMPPGTGDIPLTMAQKIPIAGAVIITTPQQMAAHDARKALEMLRKLNIYMLGVIENMSLHTCSECGHTENIFGAGGGENLAKETNTEFLGALPLDKKIATQVERGEPIGIAEPQSKDATIYDDIAIRIAAKLSLQPKNYSGKIPPVVVE